MGWAPFYAIFCTNSPELTLTSRGQCYDHNFLRFSAKILSFFSKTNVMIKILHNLALFRVKNANFFAEFFGENIFKIITSVPGHLRMEILIIRSHKFHNWRLRLNG
jgi:hypothetical protein